MCSNEEKIVFENGEIIESQEAEMGEDNNYIDPLENLEGGNE